jgi:hypothetical protein
MEVCNQVPKQRTGNGPILVCILVLGERII